MPPASVPGGSSDVPALSVVVATRDRPRLLAGCLESLAGALRGGDEVIVVDSASEDPRVAEVARRAGATRLRCERPGASRARNAGLAAARNELVAFLDDDCRPESGWAGALIEAISGHHSRGFVTGRVLAGQPAQGRAVLSVSLEASEEPASFEHGADVATVGHGANMAWRRSVLLGLGGFDEAMGPGAPLRAAEDHDLFWRALRSGVTGCYEPRAVVVHDQWRTRRQSLATYYAYGVGAGALAVKRWRLAAAGARSGEPLGRTELWWRAAGELLVGRSLPAVAGNLRQGYEMGALAEAVQAAGSLHGVLRAGRLALEDARYRTA